MKTKIESQEIKKVQHVTLTMALISVSLMIMSVAANAQESMKSYYASNEADYTAFLRNEARPVSVKKASFNATATFAALLETESENLLEVEEWMVNENNFGTFISLEAETDEPLELEEWMTDEARFYTTFEIVEEAEGELKVENWMLNSNLF
ncbi:MAG: hypothetical protein ACQETJ_09470 [Bacteroidota bacterium]